jgi:predicted acetylornithine/succinylornithine family transaminase
MIKNDQQYILNVYKRLPIEIKRGQGCYLYDQNETPFLDMFGGIAVNSLGYQHEAIQKAFDQKNNYIHLSNYFTSEPVIDLAKILVENSFASKVFFTNSGTEAIEASIKLARKWGRRIDPEKIELIAFHKGFHGRSSGGMALTGKQIYHDMFHPILPGVKHISINQIDELENVINHKTCAIFIEYIQGEGGIYTLDLEFIKRIYELKEVYHFMIIADEIQTGLMRTGKKFAYMHFGYVPDLMAVAKSLGGGLPLGALLVSKTFENVLTFGDHGSTFGGNPLACALGVATLNILFDPSFEVGVLIKSKILIDQLLTLKHKYNSIINDVRGMGLMIGIEMNFDIEKVKNAFLKSNILINITNQNVIRLLPPLVMTEDEILLFIQTFLILLENKFEVSI